MGRANFMQFASINMVLSFDLRLCSMWYLWPWGYRWVLRRMLWCAGAQIWSLPCHISSSYFSHQEAAASIGQGHGWPQYRDNNQSCVEWLETRDLSAFTFILGMVWSKLSKVGRQNLLFGCFVYLSRYVGLNFYSWTDFRQSVKYFLLWQVHSWRSCSRLLVK